MLLNKKIEIIKVSKESDGRGGWNYKEESKGYFWGRVVELSSSEVVRYLSANLMVSGKVYIRNFDNDLELELNDVIVCEGKRYLVKGVILIDKKNLYELLVSKEN